MPARTPRSLPYRAHARGLVASGALATLLALPHFAAAYPDRAIRIVVPFAPSGPAEVVARLVGQKLTETWGQQVLVDSRPGGNTAIGSEVVARAAADGYSLLLVTTSHTVNPSLMKSFPVDVLRDFSPVVLMIAAPNILVTHPSLPVRSVGDLIALAKARPGELNYGSGSIGGSTHLAAELLGITAGVRMTHIPYKGAGPASIALISGEIPWMFGTIVPTLSHVQTGRLRLIAVTSAKRSPVVPDTPTVAETLPGFEATSWQGIAAPAGTPRQVIEKFQVVIARALRTPEVREHMLRQGAEPVGGTPDEFAAYLRKETDKWARVVRTAGIKPD